MRSSPLNHLATAAVAFLVWVLAVVWGASYLGDDITFMDVVPAAFQWTYRVIMTALAVVVIAQSSYWYVYGAREGTATDLARARRIWVGALLAQVVLSGAAVAAVSIFYVAELFAPKHYALMYALAALQTWITFWVATFLMSPRPVQYIPWGKG